MAASTRTATFTNATDADFRAWAQEIHDILTDGGWVQTADAGQINLATVTAPAALNTSQGYEIWRTDDAAGSLVNFYIKIEYGSGDTSDDRPAIWITTGFASDGAGNLTGTVSTRTRFATTANPSGSVDQNTSAGDGYFCFAAYTSTAGLYMLVSIERTRGTDLEFQNEVMLIGLEGNSFKSQVINQTTAFPAISAVTGQFLMPTIGNTPVGGVAAVGIIFGMAPGPTSPSLNILGSEDASLGNAQDNIPITLYGVIHTYRIQTHSTTSNGVFMGVQGTSYMIRYE